ncbi:hypothetical protein FO519_004718 [Halicephalobus sp. NKZ332]|nr:hypothetical protein FO519_004718 [Halicephalobus sp. NKZ332]
MKVVHPNSPKTGTMARSSSDLAPMGSTIGVSNNDRSSSIPSGSSQPQSPNPNPHHIGYHGRATTCDANLCQTARSSLVTNNTHHNSTSSRGSGSSLYRDLQLIGQCKNCEKEYRCSCCQKCNHLMVFYSPRQIYEIFFDKVVYFRVSLMNSRKSPTNPDSISAAVFRHHDPQLYTALFKRKFIGRQDFEALDGRQTDSEVLGTSLQNAFSSKSSPAINIPSSSSYCSLLATSSPDSPLRLTPLRLQTNSCLQSCLMCDGCSQASKPRVSNITFSTVTSATGLPTIAAEPSRPRSSSYWKPQERNPDHPSEVPNNIGQISPQPPPVSPAPDQKQNPLVDGTSSTTNPATTTVAHSQTSSLTVATSTTTLGSPSTSSLSYCKSPKSPAPSHKVSFGLIEDESDESCSSESGMVILKAKDGTTFDRNELEKDPSLKRVSEWSFPIFHISERHKHTVLTRVTYAVFKESDLFRTFKLPYQKFFNFFHALEMGYWEIPYHNRIHAADVLHGCYYLTCHPVKAFIGRPSSPELPFPGLDVAPLPISDSMSELELMALFTAAAMHDFDHPGRTNAFLVASEDKKAILYNDRSVLENHHAAESWRLLCQRENNFIEGLDSAETKRFRYLVLEYILATDLKQHFDIIMQFNDKISDMDLSNEADRVLVSQTLIKFADINSPAKPFGLHRQWTERICQEFYEQGDEEKKRKMPISPYMDRSEPDVAKLQDSFIAHIVNPLAIALNEAGLLPVLPGLEESELVINLKHNHQKWLLEIEAQNSSLNPGDAETLGIIHNSQISPMQCLPEEESEDSSNNSVILNNNFEENIVKKISTNPLSNGHTVGHTANSKNEKFEAFGITIRALNGSVREEYL